jgi:hypothetical protein
MALSLRDLRLTVFFQERQAVPYRNAETGGRLWIHQNGLIDADHFAVGAEDGTS